MRIATTFSNRRDEPRRVRTHRLLTGLLTLLSITAFTSFTSRPGSAQVPYCEDCVRPRPLAAAGGIVSINLVTWSYDRFLARAWWARVGPETWRQNLRGGMVWDDNRLTSNQMMHPLSGAMFFNAARSSGYGYWGSMAGAAFGSVLWEYLGETHPPSPGDLVSTSVGGSALGETMRRFSHALLASRSRPGAGRRLAAGLLDPVAHASNRLGGRVTGGADLPEHIAVSVDVGFDHALGSAADRTTRFRPVLDVGVQYGDLIRDEVRRPFDVFEFLIRLGRGISSGRVYGPENPVDRLESRGALTAAVLVPDRLAFGVYQHIDFSRSPASEFGAQSLTAAIAGQTRPTGALRWSGAFHLGAMLLGSSPSRLVVEPERVNDYGPGLLGKIDTRLSTRRVDLLSLQARMYWMHDVSGSRARHLVTLVAGEARVPLGGGFGIGAAVEVSSHASFDDQLREPRVHAAATRFTVSWSPGR